MGPLAPDEIECGWNQNHFSDHGHPSLEFGIQSDMNGVLK